MGYYGLNPFETGKLFKEMNSASLQPLSVLIPSKQGSYSKEEVLTNKEKYKCLNPFETGKLFKAKWSEAVNCTVES